MTSLPYSAGLAADRNIGPKTKQNGNVKKTMPAITYIVDCTPTISLINPKVSGAAMPQAALIVKKSPKARD
jgi:hypothetical protein